MTTQDITPPQLPPLKAVKSGAHYYLCTFKNQWQNGRSVCVKGSTKSVGVVTGRKKTGRIKWKQTFLNEYPELSKFNVFREEDENHSGRLGRYHLRFEPKTTEYDEPEEEEMIPLSTALSMLQLKAGAIWVLEQIIKGTPLERALIRVFHRYKRDRKLLSLAMYMFLAQSAVLDRYAEFVSSHKMPYQNPLDGGQCSRLLASITDQEIQAFLKLLHDEGLMQDAALGDEENVYYALDSSSISCYARGLGKAQFGYNKDGDNLKQINIMMLVNQRTGVPIYYRAYAGDIPDVSTVSTFLKDYAGLQFNRKAVIVADRGYSSVLNVHRFYQTNTSFLLNFRSSFTFSKNLIREHYAQLHDVRNLDSSSGCYVVTTEVEWSYPVNCRTNCKVRTPHEKKPMYVHLFFDPQIRYEAESRFNSTISVLLKKLDKGEELDSSEEKIKEQYLVMQTDKSGGQRWDLDCSKRAEFLLNKGVQILISDTVATADEARRAYDMRNSVELAFGMLKQRVGGRRLHISTEPTMRGKIFVLFLATALGLMFRCRRHNCNKPEVLAAAGSDHQVLDMLDNIEAKVWKQGLYYSEITGKRRLILEALGVPLPQKEVFDSREMDADNRDDDEDLSEEDLLLFNLQEMFKG